mmetsp:Transcript_13478/g.44992  ORF Transcript_13478/g.44992 Transcript_13478/m.44992 type:complete len:212 (+) Transcript_13478:1090-1725(+)
MLLDLLHDRELCRGHRSEAAPARLQPRRPAHLHRLAGRGERRGRRGVEGLGCGHHRDDRPNALRHERSDAGVVDDGAVAKVAGRLVEHALLERAVVGRRLDVEPATECSEERVAAANKVELCLEHVAREADERIEREAVGRHVAARRAPLAAGLRELVRGDVKRLSVVEPERRRLAAASAELPMVERHLGRAVGLRLVLGVDCGGGGDPWH